MTDTTNETGPANADEVVAAAAQQRTWFDELGDKAKAARGSDYDGTLTPKLLLELQPLLNEPTPREYVKHTPPTDGKPYASTGLNSPQFQIDVMNAVLGLAHWRVLPFHPQNQDGVARTHVIVGNNLAQAKLDEHGELVPGEAEILATHSGWGAVKRGNTIGDQRKGAETNALKRTLARFGPGADVYRADFDDENLGGTGAPVGSGVSTGGSRRQPDVASAKQQAMLRGRAADAGFDDSYLANLILWVNGSETRAFTTAQEASGYLSQLLAALPGNLVDPVLQAIGQAKAQQAAAAAQPVAPDVPTTLDPAPAAMSPVPVTSGPNGAAPTAQAA